MMLSEESDIDFIERYLRNKLSPFELEVFQQRIKNDPDFAEKTDDLGLIMRGIERRGLIEFEEEVLAWEKEAQAEAVQNFSHLSSPAFKPSSKIKTLTKARGSTRQGWVNYLSVAAAIMLVVAGVIFALDHFENKDLNRIFAAHFSPHIDMGSAKNDERPITFSQALQSFNQQHFSRAISEFDSYLKQHPEDKQALFYLGVSQLALGRNADAVTSLTDLQKSSSTLGPSAEWYIALAHIRMHNIREAKKLLKKIKESASHPFKANAEKLLLEL